MFILITVALLIVAPASSSCTWLSPNSVGDDYVLFIGENKAYEPEINHVANLLASQPADDPEQIAKFIIAQRDLVRSVKDTPDDQKMFDYPKDRLSQLALYLDALVELTQQDEPTASCSKPTDTGCLLGCSYWANEVVFQTINSRFGGLIKFVKRNKSDTEDAKLYAFLHHFLIQKLRRCQHSLAGKLWSSLGRKNQEGESIFDEMMSPKATLKDLALQQISSDLDLFDMDLKATEMLSVLKYRLEDKYGSDTNVGKTKTFLNLFKVACGKLLDGLLSVFQTYNIADAFAIEVDNLTLDARFQKLNEYFRLCQQVTSDRTMEQVEHNVHDRLSLTKRLTQSKNKALSYVSQRVKRVKKSE